MFFFPCFPFFLPSLFSPPPFSLSLSLSLCFSFLSSFVLVFFFLFPFCFLFWSLFSFFFVLCFCFLKRTTSKYSIRKFFLHQSFLIFVGFLSSFFLQIPFPYLCFFPDFKFLFFVQHQCLALRNASSKKHIFSNKGGLQHNGVFYEPVFCKMWKVIVFFWHFFGQFFGCFSKNTIKMGILAHFSKQKITKKRHFWKLLSGPSWKLLSGPSWLRLKKRQLGPDNNFQNFCAQFFSKKKGWNPYFYSVFWQSVFWKKTNLDQIITSKRAKLGPDNNSTATLLIYIHIYTVCHSLCPTGPCVPWRLGSAYHIYKQARCLLAYRMLHAAFANTDRVIEPPFMKRRLALGQRAGNRQPDTPPSRACDVGLP